MLSVKNLVQPPKRSSVAGDAPQLLLKLQDVFNKEKPTACHADSLAILLDEVLLEPAETAEEASVLRHQQSPKEYIMDYLAGYVAKKFSSLSCSSCVGTMRSLERAATGLILAKSRGSLQVPSSQLVALLQIVEDHLEVYTVDKTACSDVNMNIVENVLMDSRTATAAVGCKSHFVSTTAEVVQFFFLKTRLHFFTREKNKQMQAKGRASCPAGGGRKPTS
ncbi:uncharacterized protein LOC125939735 [Dermacentor silvarum]|uniref:uncharacterized protein LOC125939735 n=1 Tax=Dermacentor silvarum TaxID=543639 RepID=UPI002100AF6C|nr:uncharacterized protein LOC125939735 [Dermacentor silvarum]